jgi:hypothetical protein
LAAGLFGDVGDVPTISRFFWITIAMYFGQLGHPHVQARQQTARPPVIRRV